MEHIVIRRCAAYNNIIKTSIRLEKDEVRAEVETRKANHERAILSRARMEKLGKQGVAQKKFADARVRGLEPVMDANMAAISAGEEKSLELQEKIARINRQSAEIYSFTRTIRPPPGYAGKPISSPKLPRLNTQALSSVKLVR